MYEDVVKELRNLLRSYKATDNGNCHQAKILASAADAIEELLKAVNFHKYNSEFWEDKYNTLADEKWIPVSERLPEKPKNYPNCKLREYYFLVTLATNAVVCREYDFDNKRWPGTIKVTHWMPLPEPPKEEH